MIQLMVVIPSNSGRLNFLAHQYLGDRAIIEQVLKTMEELAHVNNDAMGAKSALLRRLLVIEAEAADGEVYSIQREQPSDTQQQQQNQSEVNVLRICIPYFGTIRLVRQDVATMEMPLSTTAIETTTPLTSNHETRPPPESQYHATAAKPALWATMSFCMSICSRVLIEAAPYHPNLSKP
ncbi:hypothetical protein AAE478_010378 [Parahypoxylon ruwenzoriense]